MTIRVTLNGHNAVALIDLGCSVLVVSRRLVSTLGATSYGGKRLSFKFAYGDASTSGEMVNLRVVKEGYWADIRCDVLDIDNDIILGLLWLMSITITHQDMAKGELRFRCMVDHTNC